VSSFPHPQRPPLVQQVNLIRLRVRYLPRPIRYFQDFLSSYPCVVGRVHLERKVQTKKPDFSGFFHILLRSFASILCPFFGVGPLFDPFMHLGRSKKLLNSYA